MNSNTIAGLYDLPVQVVTVATAERALVVPAAGLYSKLPSPLHPVGAALTVGLSDLVGSDAFDGHPFKVCYEMNVLEAGAGVFTVNLYETPLAAVGVIGATGAVAANGSAAPAGCANRSILTPMLNGVALTSATGRVRGEVVCIWDSTSLQLSSIQTYLSWVITGGNSNFVAIGAGVSLAAVASISDLNFVLSVQFAAAAATNAVTLKEFTIERV